MKWILAALVTIPLLGGLVIGTHFYLFATRPYQADQKEIHYFLIKKGENPTLLSRFLEKEHIISNENEFHWLGRILKKWNHIKAGEYALSANMTPLEVFATLTSGISVSHPVTIREGENSYDVAKSIEEKGLASAKTILELIRNQTFMKQLGFTDPLPVSLEGYLYPDTYNFNRTQTPEDLVRTMYKRFQAAWGPTEDARAREIGMTKHQVIILASMIEKETGAPWERPMISGVFHNRLKIKMRLQSDPTTIYGIWERYHGKITKADLLGYTDYNTYTVPALPIGPISNPGKDAIQAALNPQPSEFLFFVSQNDGTHIFTKSYGDHTKAVRKFQLNPKEREGKSWRDLSKKLGTTKAAEKGAGLQNKNTNGSKERAH